MPKQDPAITAHLEWLGFVRPTGLVVSALALDHHDVVLNQHDAEGQRRLRACAEDRQINGDTNAQPVLPDFRAFASNVLDWCFSPNGYAGTDEAPIPPDLEVRAPDTGEALRPQFAVRKAANQQARNAATQAAAGNPTSEWQLLVSSTDPTVDFDHVVRAKDGTDASAHGRMERLLRGTGTPAGLLFNGTSLRLVSAPHGESSGWLDFRVADMVQTAGRPIAAAMRLLLKESRLLTGPREQRLAGLLAASRKFQNEVSERLAEQVLHALYELLRGFQTAHDTSTNGELLTGPLKDNPDDIYRGLLTLVLRLVFLLYAEERDLLPQDDTYLCGYSLAGLHQRLREDAALHPDTMDQRHGAYAQLLALFRMVHDGAHSGDMKLPPRHGALFDPERYRFLEGRGNQKGGARQVSERIEPPLVSDGTIYRVLEKLIVLNGERISYRALDVEHIGSVYQTMMGFCLEQATGQSIAIKAAKKHGAPATVNLEVLLRQEPHRRGKWMRDRTDRVLTEKVRKAVAEAKTIVDIHAALDSVIDKDATPDLVAANAIVLQPSEERRRSGSHYTPRELTEPIVRTTLEPILTAKREEQAGPLRPEQILDIKVCDPALGSGAFLVEACRQLADVLVDAWHAHDAVPTIPPDENEIIFARRLVAQRCLYGVDRNPVAVDLAKLSLWLITLARDHPLTFLDHALRHGDALVGLTKRQIGAFHWKGDAPSFQDGFEALEAEKRLAKASELRRRIREAKDDVPDWELRRLLDDARFEASNVRLLGDLALVAYFEGSKPKEREQKRLELSAAVSAGNARHYRSCIEELRDEDPPLAPFHWEIEFPEVFERENAGFDAMVGNPPYAGKNTVSAANVAGYQDWLKEAHVESHGNADLVAHFFRRAFNLIRQRGASGLIATNTIAQGDTRSTGLRWICEHGGEIYDVHTRVKWPGLAAVVVSVLHIAKGRLPGQKRLDGKAVEKITAFLFHRGGSKDPARLKANAGKSFQGSIVLGMGFTFNDNDRKGVATPLAEMQRLLADNPRNREAIFPYIGGEEVNASPTHAHHRYVINFRDYPLQREDVGELWADADAERQRELRRQVVVPEDYPRPVAADWPELLGIVEERAKPERLAQRDAIGQKLWWQFLRPRPELHAAIQGAERVLVINCGATPHHAFTILPTSMVFANTLAVLSLDSHAAFCALQSRPHEIWARFFGSTLEERLRYTPSDCFETFPLPIDWETRKNLEAPGRACYDYRATLMIDNHEGLTKTYNRFHDPNEDSPAIAKLRELHAAMDHAVLDAYGWQDIPTDCEFLLDYEIDEDEWGTKKKPYRYRWPNKVRDEVLARLLELNAERAERERTADGPTGAGHTSVPVRTWGTSCE